MFYGVVSLGLNYLYLKFVSILHCTPLALKRHFKELIEFLDGFPSNAL